MKPENLFVDSHEIWYEYLLYLHSTSQIIFHMYHFSLTRITYILEILIYTALNNFISLKKKLNIFYLF